MENYNAFVEELLSLDFELKPRYKTNKGRTIYDKKEFVKGERVKETIEFADFTKYNIPNYKVHLKNLRTKAANDIVLLGLEQKRAVYNRIEHIRNQLDDFKDDFIEYTQKDKKKLPAFHELTQVSIFNYVFNIQISNLNWIDADVISSISHLLDFRIEQAHNLLMDIERCTPDGITPQKSLTPIETIELNENWLRIIHKRFSEQLRALLHNIKPNKTFEVDKLIQLEYLQIVSYVPFYNFNQFKIAYNSILVEARNKDEVLKIAIPIYKLAKKCIEWYSKYLYHAAGLLGERTPQNVIDELKGYKVYRYDVNIKIYADWTISYVTPAGIKSFERKQPRYIINRELAEYCGKIVRFLELDNKELISQIADSEVKSNRPLKIESLEDIFINSVTYKQAVDLLKNVEESPITEDFTFRLSPKAKSSLIAWLDYCIKNNLTNQQLSGHDKARVLSNSIKNYSISPKAANDGIRTSGYKAYMKKFNNYK